MKRIVAFLLCFMLAFLFACGEGESASKEESEEISDIVSKEEPASAVSTEESSVTEDSANESSLEESSEEPSEEPVKVEKITFNFTKTTLFLLESVKLDVTVSPSDAENKAYTLEIVSGKDIISIENNIISALKVGKATVKATAKDGSGVYATAEITVEEVKISKIELRAEKSEIFVGESTKITHVITPDDAENNEVAYSISSGSDYGTITSDGVLTGKKAGTVTVKATAKDGSNVTASIKIKIKNVEEPSEEPVKVDKITFNFTKTTLFLLESVKLDVTVSPSDAENKAYTLEIVSGKDIISIENNIISALKVGKATVKATACDGSGVYATAEITVEEVKISKIELRAEKSEIFVGESTKITHIITPDDAENNEVAYSISSGSDYATITSDGVLTGKKAGTVTVKATAKDGSGVCKSIDIVIKEKSVFQGSGTKNDPYIIETETDLKNLSKMAKKTGLYFKQTADITLTSEWKSIEIFKCNYDGDKHSISGLYGSESSEARDYYGLFAEIDGATVKNLTLLDVKITNAAYTTGAVAGYAKDSLLENICVSGDISTINYGGGIVGVFEAESNKNAGIYNCSYAGNISGVTNIGGIVGSFVNTVFVDENETTYESHYANIKIEGCSFRGNASGNSTIGGIVGYSENADIVKCCAVAKISLSSRNAGGIVAEYHGGSIGNNTNSRASMISECYADIDITGTDAPTSYGDAFYGGIGGWVTSYYGIDINNCAATGTIYCRGAWKDCQDKPTYNGGIWDRYRNPCGALVAYINLAKGKVNLTCNTANVDITWEKEVCREEYAYCSGSLVGWFKDAATRNLIKEEYQATGKSFDYSKCIDITEDMLTDTVIGCLDNNYCVSEDRTYFESHPRISIKSSSYLVSAYKSMPRYTYVTNIDSAAYTDKSTYTGFDFDSKWVMTENGPIPAAVTDYIK